MSNIPKKILKISDLIFILPDDFHGNLPNALMLLAAYLNIKITEENVDLKNSPNVLRHNSSDNKEHRASMEWGIFEADEDGNYHLL